MSNWSKPYNDITWRNGNAPYLNAENLNENQSWIKELDSRTKELYARTDTAEPGGIARDVYFDNGTSGLDADNVQDAIDKIASGGITVVVLGAGDDLDNAIDPSKAYTFTSANCPAHSPDSTKNFYMEVMFDGGSGDPRRRQVAYTQGSDIKWERIKAFNESWGAWSRIDTAQVTDMMWVKSVTVAPSSMKTIAEYGLIPSEGMYYMFLATQTSSLNNASIYMVRLYNGTYYATALVQGSSATAPKVDNTTGALHPQTAQSSNITMKAFIVKVY